MEHTFLILLIYPLQCLFHYRKSYFLLRYLTFLVISEGVTSPFLDFFFFSKNRYFSGIGGPIEVFVQDCGCDTISMFK